ncbi:MAG: hypothetical protein ACTSPV_11615, partial [Candidatus Hodarchaeales archaeon]
SSQSFVVYNEIKNITGGIGGTGGGNGASGGLGGDGIGIHLINSSGNIIENNIFNNIKGGEGGIGGYHGSGGIGGVGTGIYLLNSSQNILKNNSMNTISGGSGGRAGYNGNAGISGVNTKVTIYSAIYNVEIYYSDQTGTTSYPEYNESNTVSILVSEITEPLGLSLISLYYRTDEMLWDMVDVTTSNNYTFFDEVLSFGEIWDWFFQINDSIGNIVETPLQSFTVVDYTSPTYSGMTQSSSTPEYDESNNVSVSIFEPTDASRIVTILVYYRINLDSWIMVDVTTTSYFIFTANMLSYGEIYDWFFWFNDKEGNSNQTQMKSFMVVDNTVSSWFILNQTSPTPEHNENNIVFVNVTEPLDASGVDTVLLYYRLDSGSWTVIDVSSTQNYTFTANMLIYNQFYEWYFWFNDTAGNSAQTPLQSFIVVDTISPHIIIFSPSNTSYFINKVWLNISIDEPEFWMGYSLDGDSNLTIITNVLLTSLSEGSHWVVVYANDSAGNMGVSTPVWFSIIKPTTTTPSTSIPPTSPTTTSPITSVPSTLTSQFSETTPPKSSPGFVFTFSFLVLISLLAFVSKRRKKNRK